jgi:hypothetical protein
MEVLAEVRHTCTTEVAQQHQRDAIVKSRIEAMERELERLARANAAAHPPSLQDELPALRREVESLRATSVRATDGVAELIHASTGMGHRLSLVERSQVGLDAGLIARQSAAQLSEMVQECKRDMFIELQHEASYRYTALSEELRNLKRQAAEWQDFGVVLHGIQSRLLETATGGDRLMRTDQRAAQTVLQAKLSAMEAWRDDISLQVAELGAQMDRIALLGSHSKSAATEPRLSSLQTPDARQSWSIHSKKSVSSRGLDGSFWQEEASVPERLQ